MINFLVCIISIYGILVMLFCIFWIRQPILSNLELSNKKFSILIPVRNEEKNILALLNDLNQQNYPKELFEILILNDSSTDNTSYLVNKFIQENELDIRLIDLEHDDSNSAPKKRAISYGINLAQNDLIICTDGDCRVGKNWILAFANYYEKYDSKFISGPVTFFSSKTSFLNNIWHYFQVVEFASLTGSGAASIFMGNPNMCSGANISYPKSVFYEVNGFEGNTHLASGDDEFLMHKISKMYPKKVYYLKSFDAIVSTESLPNFKSFYYQRKRWASKWNKYIKVTPILLAIFIFMVNLTAIYFLISSNWPWYLFKIIPEMLFLALVLSFYKNFKAILFIPFLQVFYPFYVIFFGLIVQFNHSYTWKSRKLK
jgi:cellulose synthase/poly-beta-1,6-N-acetylglucosamine synthase-like glycosyltransferase